MAQVDPNDDEIERFVVRRYAYDPARRERRHTVAAAFDNSLEFEAAIDAVAADLRRRRESGEDVDPREHVSGTVSEPGITVSSRAAGSSSTQSSAEPLSTPRPGTVSPTICLPAWQSSDPSPTRMRNRRQRTFLIAR